MANLFEGASKLKNEAEEIDKVLERLKLTSARLEKIEKTFSEVENISPDLKKIKEEIVAIKEEYKNIDGKAISNAINDLVNKIFDNWKLWLLYIPLGGFLIAFIMVSYFYMINVRRMAEENRILSDRINSVYKIHLLDKKFWYNEFSQNLFLSDKEWLKEQIKAEKENSKK